MMRMQATAERLASPNRISRECEGKSISWSSDGDLVVAVNGINSHYLGQTAAAGGTFAGDKLVMGQSSSTDIARAALAEMGVRPREMTAVLPVAEPLFAGLADLDSHTLHLSHGADVVARTLGIESSRDNIEINLA